jgi:hypothetical protein
LPGCYRRVRVACFRRWPDPNRGVPDTAVGVTVPRPVPPEGYVRVSWVTCGHSADAPRDHDWRPKHWCPVCAPGQVDRDCAGIEYVNVEHVPPVAVRPDRCSLCGGEPAVLYLFGRRCASCAAPLISGVG